MSRFLIPRNSGATVEKALCDAVTNSSRGQATLSFDAELDSGPKPELSCGEHDVRVGFTSPAVPSSRVTSEDWELLSQTIAGTGADRLVVQSADARLTTMTEMADGMLGSNLTDDMRARLIDIWKESGWEELAKAPSVIAFMATGPQGVQIFSVFPTEDTAEAARRSFTKAIPSDDFYSRTPMGGGGVVVDRQGRVLVLDCPNINFTPRFAYSSPGTFPTFFVTKSAL